MGFNMPKLPHFGPIIILLLDVIENLIIGQDLFILIIIDRAAELEPFSLVMEFGIVVLKGLENMSMEPLTVLLWIKQESAANKVGGVECRELRQLGLIFISGRQVRILATWIKWHLVDRMVAQPHKRRQLPTKRINSQVLLSRLNCRADGRMEEDLLGIVSKYLECHCMANMLCKANKMSTTFLGLRRKNGGLPMPKINRLPKKEV